MNYGEVKKLVHLVETSDIQELEFEREGVRLRISKGSGGVAGQASAAMMPGGGYPMQWAMPSMPAGSWPSAPSPASAAPSAAPAASPAVAAKVHHEIKSPMVGTFYCAPAPDAAPFVQVGDKVRPGQTLCIIEAMKLMNEIECDVSGTVVSVELENAQPVEYGQILFMIDTQG